MKKPLDQLFTTSHTKGRERLFELGRILATDTFINFSTRFPAIFGIDKSASPAGASKAVFENLLFELLAPAATTHSFIIYSKDDSPQYEVGNLYAISSKCNCFRSESAATQAATVNYLNRLEKFVGQVFADCKAVMKGDTELSSYPFACLDPIMTTLDKKQASLSGLCCLEIVLGIVVGYYNIIGMGTDRVERMFQKAKMIAIAENRPQWDQEVTATINMEFFKEAYELINHHMQLNVDAVGWVLKV